MPKRKVPSAKNLKVVKRFRRPGELSSPRDAIRCHCLDCCNFQANEVLLCPSTSCHLWPWRIRTKIGEITIAPERQDGQFHAFTPIVMGLPAAEDPSGD